MLPATVWLTCAVRLTSAVDWTLAVKWLLVCSGVTAALRVTVGVTVTEPPTCTVAPLLSLYRSLLMLTANPAAAPAAAVAGLLSCTPGWLAVNRVSRPAVRVLPTARSPADNAWSSAAGVLATVVVRPTVVTPVTWRSSPLGVSAPTPVTTMSPALRPRTCAGGLVNLRLPSGCTAVSAVTEPAASTTVRLPAAASGLVGAEVATGPAPTALTARTMNVYAVPAVSPVVVVVIVVAPSATGGPPPGLVVTV